MVQELLEAQGDGKRGRFAVKSLRCKNNIYFGSRFVLV